MSLCCAFRREENYTCTDLTEDQIEWFTMVESTENFIDIILEETDTLLTCLPLLTVTICTLGFLGNGFVIWLLGFCIKRNPFTTYVLNLSIADLGFLVSEWILYSPVPLTYKVPLHLLIKTIYQSMYSASQYFLTVISVDRCVSVFFPLWYRCHRPKRLSAIFCALIWVISFLPSSIVFMIYLDGKGIYFDYIDYQVIVNGFLCLPLMAISSLMLVSKVCPKLEQRQQRKLLTMVLLNVLFFSILSFPMNVAYICYHFFLTRIDILEFLKVIGTCLNSGINPIIYGLVVRPKKGGFMKNLKTMLQSLFSGEEPSLETRETIPLE